MRGWVDSRDEVGEASGWGGGLMDLDRGGRGVEGGRERGGRGWGEEVVVGEGGGEGDVGLGGEFDEGYFL